MIKLMHRWLLLLTAGLMLAGSGAGCGRSSLPSPWGPGEDPGSGGSAGAGGGTGGEGGEIGCLPGEVLICGIDIGECATGLRYCIDGVFGPCQGAIDPIAELCNDLDDDCDGQIDNGFGLGQACDGPDSDLCQDDEMTCDGCSPGDDNLEICNGTDDNCNGVIDQDCDYGDCQPDLLVTGSTPSSPSCIDFPVEAGSTGTIQYPCTGGPVSAVLGSIVFTGSVTNGQVWLTGTQQLIGPDDCLWQTDHYIQGSLSTGTLTYSYYETLLDTGPACWNPCTEVGTVDVQW